VTPGRIIFVNGASSAGKSTLARALQRQLDQPFWHVSIDHFRDSGMLPMDRIRAGDFAWQAMRPAFFRGFHNCLPAIAAAGNDLIVEHIVETPAWLADLTRLLRDVDVYFVGLHCPLAELERRERERGDRTHGDARRDAETIHSFVTYDLELDSSISADVNATTLIAGWKQRRHPSAFQRMVTA